MAILFKPSNITVLNQCNLGNALQSLEANPALSDLGVDSFLIDPNLRPPILNPPTNSLTHPNKLPLVWRPYLLSNLHVHHSSDPHSRIEKSLIGINCSHSRLASGVKLNRP